MPQVLQINIKNRIIKNLNFTLTICNGNTSDSGKKIQVHLQFTKKNLQKLKYKSEFIFVVYNQSTI